MRNVVPLLHSLLLGKAAAEYLYIYRHTVQTLFLDSGLCKSSSLVKHTQFCTFGMCCGSLLSCIHMQSETFQRRIDKAVNCEE